jgi:hypothetical protein
MPGTRRVLRGAQSPSASAFDLQAVFETVAESSVRLCEADRAFIFRFDGELLRMVVGYNFTPGL